jgi:hypothetical protein
MKSMSPYMLVRKMSLDETAEGTEITPKKPTPAHRAAKEIESAARADIERKIKRLLTSSPELAHSFNEMGPEFRRTLLDSCAVGLVPSKVGKIAHKTRPKQAKEAASTRAPRLSVNALKATKGARSDAGANEYLSQIAHDLGRASKVERIGLLDLGVWIAGLPDLLSRLNAAQDPYILFEINAPVPAGLRKTPEGLAEWMRHQGLKPSKAERARLEPHVIANEFFTVGADIRSGMGFDMIIGFVPVMVAGDDDGEIYWNHFSSVSEDVALVSTTDLRDFALQAGRPFEAAVGVLLIGAMLVRSNAKLGYHPNRGCVLDYNEDRTSLIETIRALKICSTCSEEMDSAQRTAATAMLDALRKMKRKPK